MIETPPRFDRTSRLRMLTIGGLLLLGFSAVTFRAVQLHMTKQGSLQWIAQKQYQAVIPVAKRRGKILDARGRELAVSVPVHSIFADPSAMADPKAALDAIETIAPLGEDRLAIERRMRPDRKFAWVKRRITPEIAERIRELKIPGMHFVEESRRVYPNGALASQVLGAVGFDAEPLAGLELAFDKYLQTKNSNLTYRRDARGRVYFSPVSFDAQDDVGTMQLTIDKIIQYITEQALDRAFEATQARGVMAVVLDVKTGRVLALANRPTFNPNEYFKYPQEGWRNRVVTDVYEPGSTFKVLVASAALEMGISADDRFYCEQGNLRVGNAVLHDHGTAYGELSMRDIIKVSSNIGSYKIASELGPQQVAKFLAAFGIGERLGFDFPGEVGGLLRSYKSWQPVEFATIAFGQGVAVTPLHMATAFATIANDGVMMRPYLVEKVTGKNGEILYHTEPTQVRRVMKPAAAQVMRDLLRGVVGEGGTGRAAASALYSTAGKTGTAQKVADGGRGYASGKYFASFIGIAPYETPRIAVFVGVDEPKGAYYGGAVAAPVFREIVEATLQYLEIPLSQAPVLLANGGSDLSDEIPASPSDAEPKAFVAGESGLVMPDLRGLSIRHVIRLANEAELPLRVAGSGVAIAQRPAPGMVVSKRGPIEVDFSVPK